MNHEEQQLRCSGSQATDQATKAGFFTLCLQGPLESPSCECVEVIARALVLVL